MAKTEYEKELKKQSQATLVYMCESKGLLHTGDKDVLIARLVEAEKAESESEPSVKPSEPGLPPAPPEE